MLRIVLSGPREYEQEARIELADAGYKVLDTQESHGLAWPASLSFVTVEGDDVDAVGDCVAYLGYRVRLHHGELRECEPVPAGAFWSFPLSFGGVV